MSQYIVSARKYRPDSFESLIGQDNIVQTLKNSILRNQLAHAYLFCGPRGVGKTSAARIFAKTINCANPSENMEPCGECESCISFKEGRSYCIHEMDAASNNSVEDIKALIEQVNIPPQIGRYSVYIVDEVHMLSTAAFNAFLKTLEEPPAHAIFILATTEKHKIPSTILSRCQTFDFNRISVKDAVRNLRQIADKENIKIDDEALHVIAMKSDGAMRDALTIFDQTVAFCGTDIKYEEVLKNLNVLDYDYTFNLVEDFIKGDYISAMVTFNEIMAKGFNALYFVSALSTHFRNLMVCRSNGAESLLELPQSLKERYLQQAGRCSLAFLFEALSATTQCESGYKASVNPRLHIEFTLMKLCFMLNKPSQVPAQHTSATLAAPVAPVKEESPVEKEELQEKPNPIVEKQPDEKPKVRRRVAPIKSSLSLSAVKEELAESVVEVEEKVSSDTDAIPEDETIIGKWKEMAADFSDRPRLATALSEAELRFEMKGNIKQVTFLVSNEAQKKWIMEKLLRNLEATLQNKTNSSRISLLIDVAEVEDASKKQFTPKEKAQALANSNPEVFNLIKDMDLDL